MLQHSLILKKESGDTVHTVLEEETHRPGCNDQRENAVRDEVQEKANTLSRNRSPEIAEKVRHGAEHSLAAVVSPAERR